MIKAGESCSLPFRNILEISEMMSASRAELQVFLSWMVFNYHLGFIYT